jgi:hypothetical protein
MKFCAIAFIVSFRLRKTPTAAQPWRNADAAVVQIQQDVRVNQHSHYRPRSP